MYTSDELPALTQQPTPQAQRRVLLVATNLEQWAQYRVVPLTFVQLLSGSGDGAQTAAAMTQLAHMVGEVVWNPS